MTTSLPDWLQADVQPGWFPETDAKVEMRIRRFWASADKECANGCWEWAKGRSSDGYGAVGTEYWGTRIAHRIAWILTFGDIPDGILVCHHCDNPPCVNPDHLFLGTVRDNSKDMYDKGRGPFPKREPRDPKWDTSRIPRGEKHHAARLSESQVREIKRMLLGGMTCREIASQFPVTVKAIEHISSGYRWSHVVVEVQ